MTRDPGPEDRAYCADQVRRFDNDRYLMTLFAGGAARDDLLALYAFNLEVAKVREIVREPMMGRIRLQWWRDCIAEIYAGGERRHQVAQPLAAAIRRCHLPRVYFDRLLEAREADMDDSPPTDLRALTSYAEATSAPLGLLALQVLHPAANRDAQSAIQQVWTVWSLVGLLRAVPFHARSRRLYLPQSLLAGQGVAIGDLFELRQPPALATVVCAVAAEARRHLQEARALARALPRRTLPAAMPATLAARYLRRLEAAGHDVFSAGVQQAPPARVWWLLLAYLRGRA